MSTPMKPIDSPLGDNDDTAELPMLDVAAYEASLAEDRASDTDTWVLPQAMRAPAPAAVPHVPTLEAAPLRGVPTEVDLGALSATLQAVEERLRVKSERLVALEREIGEVREDRAQALATGDSAREQLAQQRRAVEELQAALAAAQSRAVDAEARVVAAQARAVEAERLANDSQLELTAARDQAAQVETRANDALTRNDALARRILELEETARIAAAAHEAALVRVNTDIALHREQLTEQAATLGSRITGLDAALAAAVAARQTAEVRTSELETEHSQRLAAIESQQRQRIAQLEAEIGRMDNEHATAVSALQADHSKRLDELETLNARRETELQQQFEWKERDLLTRLEDRDADLRAAEESLRRVENELRSKTVQLEGTLRETDEFRHTIVEAQAALSEREQRIRSLETQVASSASAFGALQKSIERLDPVGLTGEEVALEGPQRLLIRTDGNTDYVHVLGRRTRIGRTPDNELQIDAKYISRNHAVLLAGPINTTIEDLGSTNGVFVNGKRVARQALKDGDRVTVGRTQFRYAVRALAER